MTLNFVGLIFLFVSGYFQGDFVVDSTFLNNGHESNLRIFRQNIKSDRNGSRVKIMTHSHDGNGVNEIRHLNMKYDPNPLAEDITTSTHRSRQQIDSNPNNGYTIEVLIVIDTSMQIFHTKKGSNVTEYVLSLMSMVIDMFAHTSIGSFIDVAVVGIEKNLVVEKDNDMLASFQNSMSNQTRKRNYDVGLLLTR
ncbi:A disintegrin and metalloproteinase with thrombospondin motifs 16-like [Sitodiplosis mosellana]|uniref:A disintegrin and metalloproteinase with thrombospondin motifs 16-like n=1 Tax=Sitodiplosis mosellana TaxID=263140 RepID=UPI002443EA91|nr:A disintegrin and metalloproteinase with thrombospondin motifs 16-like [Sitodiplosis mosellana]